MVTDKKTEQINVKLSPTLKSELAKTAAKYHWSISQTACMILEQFYRDKNDIRL